MDATVMRSVILLGMLVLSIAAATPAPAAQESSIVVPNISTLTCVEKCAIACGASIFNLGKYAACVGLCITSCKIEPTSNVAAYACTRSCVSSITTIKPSVFGTYLYSPTYTLFVICILIVFQIIYDRYYCLTCRYCTLC